MSEAREGTPEDFAGLLGAARDAQQQEPTEGDEQPLRGAGLIRAMHPPIEPEPEAEPAATDPDADRKEAARLLALDPDIAHLLEGATIEELVSDAADLARTLDDLRRKREAEQAPPVSFDGGVRELTPAPSDPIADHDAFLLDLFGKPSGTGGW